MGNSSSSEEEEQKPGFLSNVKQGAEQVYNKAVETVSPSQPPSQPSSFSTAYSRSRSGGSLKKKRGKKSKKGKKSRRVRFTL